jgi:hypothetical protein
VSATTFVCPGCGTRTEHAAHGAIYVYQGIAHVYTLCGICAGLTGHKRETMLERVELVFATKGARA